MPPIDREEAERILASEASSERVSETLIRIALHDSDWRWVQTFCLEFLSISDDLAIQSAAIISLGHLARIHRILNLDLVLPALSFLLDDEMLSGKVSDALDDIRMFVEEAEKHDK